jgi:hypothetical protein
VDPNALLERFLEPFRSEAAAFRVLLAVVGICAIIVVLTVVLRAVF